MTRLRRLPPEALPLLSALNPVQKRREISFDFMGVKGTKVPLREVGDGQPLIETFLRHRKRDLCLQT